MVDSVKSFFEVKKQDCISEAIVMLSNHSFVASNRAVTVTCKCLKPDWNLAKMLL